MDDLALAKPARLSRVVQPDTILRWHRAWFWAYWRWKSRGRPGRPRVNHELRELIQRMSKENPLWGAPRIHGELLKLGFEIAESTVSKYMTRRRGPPSQTWRISAQRAAPPAGKAAPRSPSPSTRPLCGAQQSGDSSNMAQVSLFWNALTERVSPVDAYEVGAGTERAVRRGAA